MTTARDQATLGRAIQERFPRYYRYFATAFNCRGHAIRNHNRLLGSVEGVDGIKTGYTRASGFNLVTSMRRGNRHLVGVVLGGRSGGSRDATMRNLLAENLDKAATTAPSPRSPSATSEANAEGRRSRGRRAPDQTLQSQGAFSRRRARRRRCRAGARSSQSHRCCRRRRGRAAAAPGPAVQPQARTEPAPLTSGVIQTQPLAAIPGSSEPMKPVRVKTVQVKAGPIKLASAGPRSRPPSPTPSRRAPKCRKRPAPWWPRPTSPSPNARPVKIARTEMPPQPANLGTGNGILGVLPAASRRRPRPRPQAMAYVEPASRAQPQAVQQNAAIKPASAHTGWIIQVGALESEGEARARIDAARGQAKGLLTKAEPFTEPVVAKGDRKLYRARFAGLDRDQAEAVCRTLKRSDISCITVRN